MKKYDFDLGIFKGKVYTGGVFKNTSIGIKKNKIAHIGELKEERLRKHEVTYEGHVAELARLREAALKKGSFSSAVYAEANRGKAAGLYIDRKIIKTGKLEDMSEQELEAKMKQILDDYSQIIDVTPSAITSESSSPNPEESSSDPQN